MLFSYYYIILNNIKFISLFLYWHIYEVCIICIYYQVDSLGNKKINYLTKM